MATETKPSTKAEAWDQFVSALETAFPGKSNARFPALSNVQIRRKITDTARKGGVIALQVRNFAGAIRELDDIGRITRAGRRWQEFAD